MDINQNYQAIKEQAFKEEQERNARKNLNDKILKQISIIEKIEAKSLKEKIKLQKLTEQLNKTSSNKQENQVDSNE